MEEKLVELLELKFKDEGFEDLFFVDMTFNETNKKVEIFLDSDSQLTIDQCAKINRYLHLIEFSENQVFYIFNKLATKEWEFNDLCNSGVSRKCHVPTINLFTAHS